LEIKGLVKDKISQYLSNEITKEDVYSWVKEVIHEMLKGGIFKVRNLEVWSMITELAGIADIDDVYCDELMHRFSKILSGNESTSFSFFIQIPEKHVTNNLTNTKDILLNYSKGEKLSRSDISTLKLITNKMFTTPNTLNEVLEIQILDLLRLGYDFYPDEEEINFGLKHTVFISDDTSQETGYLAKIITLLECYEGQKGFSVHIAFNNGVGTVSIQA